MKLLLAITCFILFNSCASHSSENSIGNLHEIDSCKTAITFPNALLSEEMIESNYTGELNNYWGEDTSKLDFKHVFKDGNLVESIFYFENGEVNEKYHFKCHSLHGRCEFYHKNGQLSKIIPFRYCRREGVGIQYDSLGNEVSRVTFRNDSIIEESN